MIVAVKCDILTWALDKLGQSRWGIKCDDSSCDIANQYINSLNCEDIIAFRPQGVTDCNNLTVIYNCNFNVLKSTMGVDQNIVTLTFQTGDIVGGVAPFTYEWEFNETHFIASSPINESTLVLTLRPGKQFNTLESKIVMKITDAEGCHDERICYIRNGILLCYHNYISCANPQNLSLTNMVVTCGAPSGLLLSTL